MTQKCMPENVFSKIVPFNLMGLDMDFFFLLLSQPTAFCQIGCFFPTHPHILVIPGYYSVLVPVTLSEPFLLIILLWHCHENNVLKWADVEIHEIVDI